MVTMIAHNVVSAGMFRIRVIKMMAGADEFSELGQAQIADMADEVVRRATKAGVPFGAYQIDTDLRTAVERLCEEVPVTVLSGDPEADFAEWVQLLTWEPAFI